MPAPNYSTKTKRQVSMVMDLNKCLGCHTCSVACKKLWNKDQGTNYSYWNNVETMPGTGYPKNWDQLGSRTETGEVKRGKIPNLDTEYGRSMNFDHQAVINSNTKEGKTWLKPVKDIEWAPNWDEDEG
ncbi:MAG: respiratory nitrate reductase subunit beta, partial [Planctomycetaceae bacterium]|nr:respiratory nitrate reductase subunit beta [Planctomycetaceae bacterium]